MRKIIKKLSLLTLVFGVGPVYAYTPGSYINFGLGVSSHSWNDGITHNWNDVNCWDNGCHSNSEFIGRAGWGYLSNLSNTENPLFAGVEGNLDFTHVGRFNSNLFGLNVAGILGKQIAPKVDIFGKLGAQFDDFGTTPFIGVGIGYQVSQHVRIVTEGNFGFSSFHTAKVIESLQYHF